MELAKGMVADSRLAPGLRIVLRGTSVLPLHCAEGLIRMGSPSSMLSRCFLSLLLLLLLVLGLVGTGAWHSAWAGWHGAVRTDGCVVTARRFLPVDKHYCPIPPWARQCSQAVVRLLRRWGPGPWLLAQLPRTWANGDG